MLTELIADLRKRGLQGFAVIDQGGGNYVAGGMSASGHFTDPRSWDTHKTPEAAIEQLAGQQGIKPVKREPEDLTLALEANPVPIGNPPCLEDSAYPPSPWKQPKSFHLEE